MKTTPTLQLLMLVFVSALFSCGQYQSLNSDSAEITESLFDLENTQKTILEKTRKFTEAHITKDTAYLNHIFTDDARVLPPNVKAVIGKKAIAQLNTDWVNYGIHEFTETTTHFYGNKDYLIDEGTYHLRYGEDNTTDDGKYINIWKNVNGDWKICCNIWNSSLILSE